MEQERPTTVSRRPSFHRCECEGVYEDRSEGTNLPPSPLTRHVVSVFRTESLESVKLINQERLKVRGGAVLEALLHSRGWYELPNMKTRGLTVRGGLYTDGLTLVLPAKNMGDMWRSSSSFCAYRAFISLCRVPAARLRLSRTERGGSMGGESRLLRLPKLSQLLLSLSATASFTFTADGAELTAP